MYDKAILYGKVYMNQEFVHKHIYINGSKIVKICDELYEAEETIDVHGLEVIPGIIDPHVHFELNLGHTVSVDDFYTGSIAAVYGGVTTIIDFLDPVDHPSEIESAYQKRLDLAKKSVCDYSFHATIKKPRGNLEEFVQKIKQLGMPTLKFFTTYSDSNRRTYDEQIIELMKLSEKEHIMLLGHLENDELIRLNDTFKAADLTLSRPAISETIEALKMAEMLRAYGGKLYMVHLSSGRTLEVLSGTYKGLINKRFFIESCPQYFTFTKEILNEENGYLYTFAPPLRSKEEQALLFKYSDAIDTFGTDHCAFNASQKNQEYLKDIPLGIGGVEHSFNIMRHHLGDSVIDKMTKRVAELHGLRQKGELKEGYDADLFIYEPLKAYQVDDNHAQSDYTVYDRHPIDGKIISTMIRGQFVMRNRKFIGGKGQWLRRRLSDESSVN